MWLPAGKPLIDAWHRHLLGPVLPAIHPPLPALAFVQPVSKLACVAACGLGRGDVVVVEALVSRLHAALYHSNVLREQGLQSQKRRPS
ncbi:hypothetical protein RB213_014050 [Colletotrichum asianum]